MKVQRPLSDVKERGEKDSEASFKGEDREGYQRENVDRTGAGAEADKQRASDSYRGKQLPTGMKLKKSVSDEERNRLKAHGEQEVKDKMQENPKANKQGEAGSPVSSIKAATCEQINPTSRDLQEESSQQPTEAEPCRRDQTEPTLKKTSSTSVLNGNTTNKLTEPESSRTKSHRDDDSDDVVLVSVKPGTQKTPPASTIQKTLTTFPGFQLAPRAKSQGKDPQGLHSLLSAQLQQKKVSKGWATFLSHGYLEPFIDAD